MTCAAQWQQCGGRDWRGATNCCAPSSCVVDNEYYSQCLVSNPPPQQGGHEPTSSRTPAYDASGDDSCSFAFGTAFAGSSRSYDSVDYITAWIGQASGEDNAVTFNQHWHGAMLRAAAKAGATPVYYAYVIAFLARAHDGLNDCDVASGSLSLCIRGADFIRRQRSLILDTYEAFARATAAELPSASHRVVWLLEPDFYQYSEHSSTQLLRMVRGDDVVWERYGGLRVGAMVQQMW